MAKRPRDYRDKKSPLTQNLVRHGDFEIREVPVEKQKHKLARAINKTAKELKSLIEKRYRLPSQADYFERRILHKERVFINQQWRMAKLQKRIDEEAKRQETMKANLAREMQFHIENLAKLKPKDPFRDGLDSFKPVSKKEMDVAKKPKVKRVKATIVQVKQKRWAAK